MQKQMFAIIFSIILSTSLFVGCTNLNTFQIAQFKVEPSIINKGETANLSWIVIGAESVSIDQGIGNVSNMGKRIVFPTENTTYTLTAMNSTKTLTATTLLIVRDDEQNETEKASVVVTGTNQRINILLAVGGSNAPYLDQSGANGFDVYINGTLISHDNWNLGGEWDVGETITLTLNEDYQPLIVWTEYRVTVKIMGTVIYDSYITVLNGGQGENASVTVSGTNSRIKILLSKGGDNAPYANVTGDVGFDIFINGTKLSHSIFNIGSFWEVGESIILTVNENYDALIPGTEYLVTVKIMASVIYDAYIVVLS